MEISKFLLMKGGNPNIKNRLGDSPLGKVEITYKHLNI